MDPVSFAQIYTTEPQRRLQGIEQQNALAFNQGLQNRGQQFQEQQSMAQMAQNQQQFNALQQLRQNQQQLEQQRTMADLASTAVAQQANKLALQNQQLQLQEKQNLLNVTPKLNEAIGSIDPTNPGALQDYMQTIKSDPDLAKLPPAVTMSAFSSAMGSYNQTQGGIQQQMQNMANQRLVLGATELGIPINNFRTPDGGIDTDSLSEAYRQNFVQANRDMSNLQLNNQKDMALLNNALQQKLYTIRYAGALQDKNTRDFYNQLNKQYMQIKSQLGNPKLKLKPEQKQQLQSEAMDLNQKMNNLAFQVLPQGYWDGINDNTDEQSSQNQSQPPQASFGNWLQNNK